MKQDYPTIVVAGSGRASDAIVALIRCTKKYHIIHPTCAKIASCGATEGFFLLSRASCSIVPSHQVFLF